MWLRGSLSARVKYKFRVPRTHAKVKVIGVIRRSGPFSYDILELPSLAIDANGTRVGVEIELTVDREGVKYRSGEFEIVPLRSFRKLS